VKDEFYIPSVLRAQDSKNKQASIAGFFTKEDHQRGREIIEGCYEEAYQKYQQLLSMGVAREVARIVLPVAMYTQFYVTYNSRSLMNFIRLRSGIGAQHEIKLYADALGQIFKERMPWTFNAFDQFVLNPNYPRA
jgi:thymidylate synthase (FAD)